MSVEVEAYTVLKLGRRQLRRKRRMSSLKWSSPCGLSHSMAQFTRLYHTLFNHPHPLPTQWPSCEDLASPQRPAFPIPRSTRRRTSVCVQRTLLRPVTFFLSTANDSLVTRTFSLAVHIVFWRSLARTRSAAIMLKLYNVLTAASPGSSSRIMAETLCSAW